MKRKINLFFLIASILCSFSSKATVVYVDSAHVGGLQNGTSWATAFSDFQSGVNAANAGDSVWVAKGTYETKIDSSFKMKEGVKILGGFLNTYGNISQRNWQNNKTILKGRNSGIVPSNSVILNIDNNLTYESVIDGFTITGGNATNGGGIRNNHSSPVISNCILTQNTGDLGGGIFCGWGSSCQIINCIFDNNHASDGSGIGSDSSNLNIINCIFSNNISSDGTGGGIFNIDSHIAIKGCTFSGNTVESNLGGGGISSWFSNSLIDSCFFSDNTAGWFGGAIRLYYDTNAVIRNCTFSNNASVWGGAIFIGICANPTIEYNTFSGNTGMGIYSRGGAICNDNSNSRIRNCFFTGNRAASGGAFSNGSGSNSSIVNSLFTGNIADSIGAVASNIMNSSDPATYNVTNCTIVKNISLSNNGGTLYNDNNTSVKVLNSIIWGNTDGIIDRDATSASITNFSLIQGIAANPTTHNLDGTANPLLADTATGDYRLRFDSPCINKGNNDSIPTGILTDLAENNRIAYDTVDMGAYEYKLYVSLGNDTVICNEDGLTLNADNIGSSYLWSTGSTTQSITVNNTGTYTVAVSNIWGTATDTIHVNVSSPPVVTLGNDTTITQGSSVILNAGNPGSAYLWNTGATTQTINITVSGTYSVVVTNSAGCTGTDTIVVTVDPVDINDINTSENSLMIYPNPSKETIRISFTDEKLLHTKAMLTDIYGRTVKEVMLNSKSQQLSMAGLTSGVYILKTITGNSVKIIKQ